MAVRQQILPHIFKRPNFFFCHVDLPSVRFPIAVMRSSVYLCIAAPRDAQTVAHRELLAKIWNRHCPGMFGYVSSGDPTTACAHSWFTAAPASSGDCATGFTVSGWPVLKSDGIILSWRALEWRSELLWQYSCNLASWGLPPLALPNNAYAHVLQFPSSKNAWRDRFSASRFFTEIETFLRGLPEGLFDM